MGNEFGQVVILVLTDAEGDCLDDMPKGLLSRYERHHVEPPKVLHVDHDCCGIRLAQQLFGWPDLVIKLDIWHYMWRFATACCSESHALYGTFMAQLSGCIFEWDPGDVEQLVEAKKQQLAEGVVFLPEFNNIAKHITKRELATHCKRQTQGSEATAELIKQLPQTLVMTTQWVSHFLTRIMPRRSGMSRRGTSTAYKTLLLCNSTPRLAC